MKFFCVCSVWNERFSAFTQYEMEGILRILRIKWKASCAYSVYIGMHPAHTQYEHGGPSYIQHGYEEEYRKVRYHSLRPSYRQLSVAGFELIVGEDLRSVDLRS